MLEDVPPMNKSLQKLLLLIAVISLLLLIIVAIIFSHFDNHEMQDFQIVVTTKLENVTPADIEAVKKEVESAIRFIPQILGVEYKKTVTINIVDEGICNTRGGIVSLPLQHVRDKSAAIVHELTHVIAKHESNSFFSEGLAVYFQERFGEFKGFPNFSIPLDNLVRNNRDQLMSISILKNDNEIFRQVGTDKRRIAYIEAGSFINFLVVKYGEQKLADLHNSSSLNYKKIYGKAFKELETEWKNYVL